MAIISELKRRTKNLFNINAVELSGKCEFIDNGIKFNGSGSFDIKLPEGIYTISFTNNGIGPCWIRNGKVDTGYIATINTTDKFKTFSYKADNDGYLRISSFTAEQTLTNIQIEYGSVATDYQPYYVDVTKYNNSIISNITFNDVDYHFAKQSESTDGVCKHAVEEPIVDLKIGGNSVQDGEPTPETPIEVESVGEKTKNLFNINNVRFTATTSTNLNMYGSYVKDNKIYCGGRIGYATGSLVTISISEGETYSISFTTLGETANGEVRAITDLNGDMSIGYTNLANFSDITVGTRVERTVTIPPGHKYLCFTMYSATRHGVQMYDIQVEKNNIVTEYEPFGYKIPIKINNEEVIIYLNEPLRKIDEYVDYIDYKNKKIVRNVEVLDDSGTQTIENSYQGLATPIEEAIDIPEISTSKGINIFSIETTIQPSEFKVTYWKQIGTDDNENTAENIVQTDSNILIINTGADITQDGSNLLIGG